MRGKDEGSASVSVKRELIRHFGLRCRCSHFGSKEKSSHDKARVDPLDSNFEVAGFIRSLGLLHRPACTRLARRARRYRPKQTAR